MRAAWRVASSVMRRAFSELPAISPMVEVICSVAEATLARLVVVCSIPAATDTTLAVICSAAAATAWALSDACREPSDIWPNWRTIPPTRRREPGRRPRSP